MPIGQHFDRPACLPRHDRQAQWSPLYDLLTDPGFLDKGEFDELARTLQEEKVVFRVLCIPFYSVDYLNKVLFREITLFLCENLLFFIIFLQFGHW